MRHQFLTALLISTFATALFAQTTITYQGKLESGGEPFDDTVEMIFELHEADTGDTEIATHGPVNVEVSEGLFQEDLSFGAGVFDGDPRYLQIIIDGTPLAERHPIRPSPMALYALDSDGGGGNGVWLVGGNLDTDPSTDFLGTADESPFEIRVDGQRALYIQPAENPDFAPNLVAGHEANTIESGVLAGTIAGGGVGSRPHSVEGNYGTVGGGRDNTVSGVAATVSGGRSNLASGGRATVSGGKDNVASANWATVGGGEDNTGGGWFSMVAGGQNNLASGSRSTVGGGQRNTASGSRATVPGGGDNTADGDFSFAAGRKATAGHSGSFVWSHNDPQSEFLSTGEDQFLIRAGGGVGIGTDSPSAPLQVSGSGHFGFDDNEASGENSFVTGGSSQGLNRANGSLSAVVGGRDNIAAEQLSVIAGGLNNSITGTRSFIAGGEGNFLGGETSAVLGGASNFIWGNASSIAGGGANTITEDAGAAFVGGGGGNTVDGNLSAITGGEDNTASGENTFVGGGQSNTAAGHRTAIAGGRNNAASGNNSVVAGGIENEAIGFSSAVVGGTDNAVRDRDAFVGGGTLNEADGQRSAVAGGNTNAATASDTFVGGGWGNEASGHRAGVVAGLDNAATSNNSFIGGGSNNTAGAENTFAAGTGAQALHANTFVWSGGGANGRGVESTAENQFVVAASGAVQFLTDETRSMGVELAPGGSGWSVVSDRQAKTAIEVADPIDVLHRVVELEISEYSYKSQEKSIRHMGPMAQDFHPLFGLGEDELRISAMNLAGVALAAIQGLHGELETRNVRLQKQEQRIARLEAENAELRHELAELREQVADNSRLAKKNTALEDRLARVEALLLEDRQVAEARQ